MRVGNEQVRSAMHRGRKAIACIALVIALAVGSNTAATPAKPSESLFERLSGALAGAGMDPDQIEMARFSIDHPAEAAVVYERAAGSDYPFFALVGAAKAAKGKSFGKLGVFSETSCNLPVTAIDTVFARASSKIDGQADGIAKTDAAMGVAASYGAEAAKATTDEARRALNDQMTQSIPYFSDIKTICTFAFHTNFSTEHNLQRMATDKARQIKYAYEAFHSGNVVDGFGKIAALGVGKNVACKMIDDGVSGGVIGRTPFLGALATKACEGFTGAVIDGFLGFVKGGVGIAEAGVSYAWEAGKEGLCAVASIIGSGCSSAPPPPSAQSEAKAWCDGRGGAASTQSYTDAPDDFAVVCGDGSHCTVRPGKAPRCATAAEIAANRAQQIATASHDFDTKLPQWKSDFNARWRPRCPDSEPCLGVINLIADTNDRHARVDHEDHPELDYHFVTGIILFQAEFEAAQTIEEYRYKLLPGRWAAGFGARWKAACSDDQCRTEADFAINQTLTSIAKLRKQDARAPYSKATPYLVNAERYGGTSLENSAKRANGGKALDQTGVSWTVPPLGVGGVLVTSPAGMRNGYGLPDAGRRKPTVLLNETGVSRTATPSANGNTTVTPGAVPTGTKRLPGPPLPKSITVTPAEGNGGRGGPIRTAPSPAPRSAAAPAPTPRTAIPRAAPVAVSPAATARPIAPPSGQPGAGRGPQIRVAPTPAPTPTPTPTPAFRTLRRN